MIVVLPYDGVPTWEKVERLPHPESKLIIHLSKTSVIHYRSTVDSKRKSKFVVNKKHFKFSTAYRAFKYIFAPS